MLIFSLYLMTKAKICVGLYRFLTTLILKKHIPLRSNKCDYNHRGIRSQTNKTIFNIKHLLLAGLFVD